MTSSNALTFEKLALLLRRLTSHAIPMLQRSADSKKRPVGRLKASNTATAHLNIAVLLLALQPASAIGAAKAKAAKRSTPAPLSALKECADCPTMVRLPPMAYADGKKRTFYAARTELTWREYFAAVRDGACQIPTRLVKKNIPEKLKERLADDHPITQVEYSAFGCYLDWIKRKTGRTYRIPTGEEWEYLARAGTTTKYPWGDELGYNNAFVYSAFDKRPFWSPSKMHDPRSDVALGSAYPVAQFPPNAWGLYDVIGNASEATSDYHPPHPVCISRYDPAMCRSVIGRGGRTNSNPSEDLMTARTVWGSPTYGFRLIADE